MSILRYIETIGKIDYLIRRKATGTPKELARKIGISECSVYNYLNMMKDLGAPLEYSSYLKTYVYRDSGEFVFKFIKSRI